MKKYIAVVVSAGALAAALIIPAGASAAPSANSPAFEDSGCSSVQLTKGVGNALRFGDNGWIAISPELTENVNENAAVEPSYSGCKDLNQGLIKPPGVSE